MTKHVKIFLAISMFSIFVLSLSACPGPDWPKCENDDHCKKKKDETLDFVCVFGQCQECGRDTDCKDGKKCSRNMCVAPCSGDQDCTSGQVCGTDGVCIVGQNSALGLGSVREGEACSKTAECQSDLSCYENKCLTDDSIAGLKNSNGGTVASNTNNSTNGAICEEDMQIKFGYNMHDLNEQNRESLASAVACLESHPTWSLKIEGHADERGTTQYNLDLGDKRARTIKDYLKNMGVASNKLKTVSYGEEKPLIREQSEAAWAENRRAILRLIK